MACNGESPWATPEPAFGFGSDEHRYRLTRPLLEAEIRAFEERYAVRLPYSCRGFLTRVGGSGAFVRLVSPGRSRVRSGSTT
ncbi:hypothetical protein [Streptomyces sp. NPDC054786]